MSLTLLALLSFRCGSLTTLAAQQATPSTTTTSLLLPLTTGRFTFQFSQQKHRRRQPEVPVASRGGSSGSIQTSKRGSNGVNGNGSGGPIRQRSGKRRTTTSTTGSTATSTAIGTTMNESGGVTNDSRSSSSSDVFVDTVSPAAAARLVYGRDDVLFGCIEQQQGSKPFGSVLDAGTGLHSLRWIATLRDSPHQKLGLSHFVAVTADATMQRHCQLEMEALGVADLGTVVMGNWFPSTTTATQAKDDATLDADPAEHDHHDLPPALTAAVPLESFDVILADYLIGAMDGFSPYQQDLMIPTLARYLKPGGRLYIVGLEPIPDTVATTAVRNSNGSSSDGTIVCRVRQVRDACILLAGQRCYREYPVDWVHRQITKVPSSSSAASSTEAELTVRHTKRFPILYRHETIVKQINVGRSKLPLMSLEMQRTMGKQLDDLEAESLRVTKQSPSGRIQFGYDYVVTAEKRCRTDDATGRG